MYEGADWSNENGRNKRLPGVEYAEKDERIYILICVSRKWMLIRADFCVLFNFGVSLHALDLHPWCWMTTSLT
jgi:hypothetical protein